jgi:hypothetical protein
MHNPGIDLDAKTYGANREVPEAVQGGQATAHASRRSIGGTVLEATNSI